ncbi:hypothetical protein EGT74_24435 [Chitinophaga lutea]|uniref:Uncharacterized protein n=1 Tax=Chitinophaga lutea TaxID=2488634 RepID=A0A3N4PBQ9_9BACT|nr:hypothetical protein [Chitinophaga lutea]RPE05535.1 hypothetical protein EGT74_24435 [Chitinophaga lutea]
MSKQQKAKETQGYQAKPVMPFCINCQHFTSKVEQVKSAWSVGTYTRESEVRCGIGGFAIKKQGTCNSFTAKIDQ